MTQRSIIAIMVLVLLVIVKQAAIAGRYTTGIAIEAKALKAMKMVPGAEADPVSQIPYSESRIPEAPHGKPLKAPHMEEIPHIHRFHKERVKKIRQHHTKFWFLSQFIVVLCHLSMLFIAYLHLTH